VSFRRSNGTANDSAVQSRSAPLRQLTDAIFSALYSHSWNRIRLCSCSGERVLYGISALTGATVHALDGDIGHVSDFYFDDERWTIRYAVVTTGSWIDRHRVVVSVMSLLAPDWHGRKLPVKLTRDQLRRSPDMMAHSEIARLHESELLSYYGYPFYWAGDALWGRVVNPAKAAEQSVSAAQPGGVLGAQEVHLHLCRDVIGYHVHARDGEIGHVDELLVDPETWSIRHLVLDPATGLAGVP
jgi:hypothetical protein